MKTNAVLKKLRSGEPTIGSFLGLGSPGVAELMAHAGYDWLIVETEHNGLDSAEIEHMLRAIDGTETVPMVRVPSASHVYIQRALDMGAMGVLVPMVRSAAEAEAIVKATWFPPEGTRSWGPLRASGYTFDNEDYFERANDNILVSLIIETREASEDLDAIASVPGVDVLTLGPWDLSLALGLDPRRLPLPEVDAVLDKMLAIAEAGDVAVGAGASSADELRALMQRGVRFLAHGPDYALLANAAREGLAEFRG